MYLTQTHFNIPPHVDPFNNGTKYGPFMLDYHQHVIRPTIFLRILLIVLRLLCWHDMYSWVHFLTVLGLMVT